MECRDTKLLIEACWDRHLPPEMAERVERHLDACPGCRAEYRPLTQLLTAPEPVAVPDRLRERILSAIAPLPMPAAGAAGRRAGLRWWLEILHAPWAGALAACLTFAFLGWVSSWIPSGREIRVDLVSPGTVSMEAPHPLLAAGWAHAMALPGPGGPLAAVAQTAALERLIQPPDAAPADFVRQRSYVPEAPPADSTPALPELLIVQKFLTLGA